MIFPTTTATLRWAAYLSILPSVWAQSGGAQSGLKYGENWLPTVKDSELVARNFPNVDIELLSPAFLKPEGPTDHIELDFFVRDLARKNEWMTYEAADFLSEEDRTVPYVFLSRPNTQNTPKLHVYLQEAIHGNEPAADQSILALLGKMNANQT
ncbi:hypothetical protein PG994_006972 [Apiospora phragmitis]|uniref:Peptidase M14 carboxypeptidase A domain-containing protein n=1 Tax=Apiospora phragmitis TaxID=2905665 RepID=A0ABR1UZG3_9PEZI